MIPLVVSVKCLTGKRLELEFSDGERRVFDVNPLLGLGRFARLSEEALFLQAHIEFQTVCWPDGLDLDPEFLYEASIPQSASYEITKNPILDYAMEKPETKKE
jgi:hypothetical protein